MPGLGNEGELFFWGGRRGAASSCLCAMMCFVVMCFTESGDMYTRCIV